MQNLSSFINKNFVYAVIGATQNKNKYGYKIFRNLLSRNFNVYPINPKYKTIEKIKCFPSLSSLSQSKIKPDVVVFVVPPKISLEVLKEVRDLGIKKAWFQPGSSDSKTISFCKQNNIDYIADMCFMQI